MLHFFLPRPLLWASILWAVLCPLAALSADQPIIKAADFFPEIPLMLPPNSGFESYLGIEPLKPFVIGNIKADLVVVEIMNINCGSCQKQAPVYNELYNKIASSPEYKDKIKILSVGVGNQNEFIKKYQDHFKAAYPIIEDPALTLYNAIGKSAVPMAVYIRPEKGTGKALVLTTHTGYESDPEAIFSRMISLLALDSSAVTRDKKNTDVYIKVPPAITEGELLDKLKTAFQKQEKTYSQIDRITMADGSIVYTSVQKNNAPSSRIFARMVSEPPPCDLCHDSHFFYVFDSKGKILQFVPVRLTKYGNKPWTEKNIQQMKYRVEGRMMNELFSFNEKVDAITSATITSLVIIESLNNGKTVFNELKSMGMLDESMAENLKGE